MSAAPAAPPATPPPPPLPDPVPFPTAVENAATTLFGKAQIPDERSAGAPIPVVIDPLVDGVTGGMSRSSVAMGEMIADIVAAKFPNFEILPMTPENIQRQPLVLVGTFTGLNKDLKPIGERETFRVCLVLADLALGRTVGKGVARALPAGIDLTPTPYLAQSPAWRLDPYMEGYIKTCQATKPGDPINPVYLEGVLTASIVSEAVAAYDEGRFSDSLELFNNALLTPAGQQLRVLNGVYMANWQLGRRDAAADAFGEIVDYGLSTDRLAVKLLFKPGSTAFWPDPSVSGPYPIWLETIAQRAARRGTCLEVTGHTTKTGSAAFNDRLSELRAELIKARLEGLEPSLQGKILASGAGSRENIIGSGQDDATDALDRRVDFKPFDC
ncbi:MAG TPA: OmpA family protein [Geminicoccus sp.]|uniref:OmpA family protein n=1 Tax=Geminicoccus sp. TaxID=2024832 RepID=UPI002E354FC8|nr:OmpA family protein [Geminicoccus sp.]HEX2526562.1 OmpA family protein [Geminicoccus sp.]